MLIIGVNLMQKNKKKMQKKKKEMVVYCGNYYAIKSKV